MTQARAARRVMAKQPERTNLVATALRANVAAGETMAL